MAVDNLITLGRLIAAGADKLLLESHSIENPDLFLDFCRRNNLSSFLYSLYSKEDFEVAFPSAESSSFIKEFQKSWAVNLRYDTIREELNRLLLQSLGIECLFLDFSLRTRAVYGNRFQRTDRVIQILMPSEIKMNAAGAVMRGAGFARIYPEFEVLAKVRRRLNYATDTVYFKRNEFLVSINAALPTTFGGYVNGRLLLERKERIEVSSGQFYVLSEGDHLIFSLLAFWEGVLLGFSCLEEVVYAYLVIDKGNPSGNDVLDDKLRRLLDDGSRQVKEVFCGAAGFKSMSLLRRLRLYMQYAPNVKMFDIFRIVFRLRYFQ